MTLSIRAAALAACALSLGACATVTRGTATSWSIASSPPGASVKTSNGMGCDATPCSISMPRKAQFSATVSKPGYKSQTVQVSSNMSSAGAAAMVGNVLIGGIIGIGVDAVSGATNDLTPNDVNLVLEDERLPLSADQAQTLAAAEPPLAPIPTPPRPSWPDDRPASSSLETRVVALKVRPDGSVTETRARAF